MASDSVDPANMKGVELIEILREHKISGYSGKPKRVLVEMVREHLQMPKTKESDKKEKDTTTSKKAVVTEQENEDDVDIEKITFADRSELETKLCGFTVAELRKALKARGAPAKGRKLDVVAHLASLIEEERLRLLSTQGYKDQTPLSIEESPTDDDHISVGSLRRLLEMKGMTAKVDYSKFLDIEHFSHCVEREEYLLRNQEMKESIESLKIILQNSIRALGPKNIRMDTLKTYLTALKVDFKDDWNCEQFINKLEDVGDTLLDLSDVEGEKSSGRIIQVMKEWLTSIEEQLTVNSELAELNSWTDEQLHSKLAEFELTVSSRRDTNEAMVKHHIMTDTNFLTRMLSILAMQMLYRSQTLKASELAFVFTLSDVRMHQVMESVAMTELFRLAFLKASVPAFFQLFNTKLEEERRTMEELNFSTQGEGLLALRSKKRLEEDPLVDFGVVFGGGGDNDRVLADNISSVRCLLDHLQTAPYITSDASDSTDKTKEEKGFKLFLYYLGSNSNEVFKLTIAEFLSLDVREFESWSDKTHHKGEKISSFDEFLKDLKSYDCVVSLTPSLDVFASQSKAHEKILQELDPFFYGSHWSARLMTQNMFGCLTYLKSRGLSTPLIYRIKTEDLIDLETWTNGFKRFCHFHGIVEDEQEFQLTPYSAHSYERPIECIGLSGIVRAALSVLDLEKIEKEALIQPVVSKDRGIDFSCVVLETRKLPVALMPTEIEYIEPEYVRSMSASLRRHTPPRFTLEIMQAMRENAVKAFEELDLSGYACINGRVMMDVEQEHENNNKDLPLPRPIPYVPGSIEPRPLPEEFLNHMEGLLEQRDAELEGMVKAYESSEYTVEGLKYLRALDARDAAQGLETNHYHALEEKVKTARAHLREAKNGNGAKFSRIRQLETEVLKEDNEMFDEGWVEPDTDEPMKSRDDFSVVITGVRSDMSLSTNSLLFQQAAASGLPHASVLRHLLEIGLPDDYKLSPVENQPRTNNPLFPECYNESDNENTSQTETFWIEEPKPLQVWILCGGDGTGHQSSFSAGLNVLMKMKRARYTQPSLFVLDPGRRTSASPGVLKRLYKRRNELLKKGISEEDMPDECKMEYLKSPNATKFDLPWHPVWCLDDAHSLCSTLDEAIEESDRTRLMEQTAVSARKDYMNAFREIQVICQKDLDQAGVSGVASLWGGDVEEIGPPPRMVTLETFVSEAKEIGAVVFLAVNGTVVQSGDLQDFFETHNVQYTGSRLNATRLCGSKEEIAVYLTDLGETRVLSHRFITKEEIVECGVDADKAEEIFEETAAFLGTRDMCVKPLRESFGGGIAHLSTVNDLEVYGIALMKNWEVIDGSFLQQPHSAVPMSKPSSESYIIQPYIPPAKFVKSIDGELTLSRASQIVELTFGLIGDLGQMIVLSPSLVLSNLEESDSFERKYLKGMRNCVTPVPAGVVPEDALGAAKKTIERLADAMALRGVARVDAFLNVVTNELTIIEVDSIPDLGEHSVIFQQVLLNFCILIAHQFYSI